MLRSEMLKGVVELLVLAVLSRRESYGYQVVKDLEDSGWAGVSEATIYGTLRRLHEDGYLSSRQELSSGRARRYYSLSSAGRTELTRHRQDWQDLSTLVTRTLEGVRGVG